MRNCLDNAHLWLIIPGAAASLSGEACVVTVAATTCTPLTMIPHLSTRKAVSTLVLVLHIINFLPMPSLVVYLYKSYLSLVFTFLP